MRSSLPLLMLLLVWGATVAMADAPGEKTSAALHSVQADFVQEKELGILAHPLVSQGFLAFQAPASLRWEYRSPLVSLLLMHGGTVKRYAERDGKLVEEPRAGLDAMQVVLSEISAWLSGRFTDNAMFSVSEPAAGRVVLTPKEEGMRALISSIELLFADRRGVLRQVTIFEGPDSRTRLTFSNQVLNRTLPDSLFLEP